MQVYDIHTPFNHSQTSSVVAESMAKAEEIFLKKYPYTVINSIVLHSQYVLIQEIVQSTYQIEGDEGMDNCSHDWRQEYYDYYDLHIKMSCRKCNEVKMMSPERQHEKADEAYLVSLLKFKP